MMGGFYRKKKSTEQGAAKEEIVTHTKFYFDEGIRTEEEGDRDRRGER